MKRLWFLLCLLMPTNPSFGIGEPVNYETLNHEIKVTSLRAGNHDSDNQNIYYLVVTMHALIIAKEEHKLGFEKRKKVSAPMGELGDFQLQPLTFWLKDENPVEGVKISGDQLRQLTAQAMREFEVVEEQVAIRVVISMFEREKQWGFLGEDQKVGETLYEAVPEKLPRLPNKKNQDLEMVDDKGMFVKISVSYDINQKVAGGK